MNAIRYSLQRGVNGSIYLVGHDEDNYRIICELFPYMSREEKLKEIRKGLERLIDNHGIENCVLYQGTLDANIGVTLQ